MKRTSRAYTNGKLKKSALAFLCVVAICSWTFAQGDEIGGVQEQAVQAETDIITDTKTDKEKKTANSEDTTAEELLVDKTTLSQIMPYSIPEGTADANAIAIGDGSNAGDSSVAIGKQANAYLGATAVGSNAQATGASSIALGMNATASGETSISLGTLAQATGKNSIGLGMQATSYGEGALALGYLAIVKPSGDTVTSVDHSVAIGNLSRAIAANSVALGYGAGVYFNSVEGATSEEITAANGIAIGQMSSVKGLNSAAFGGNTSVTGTNSVVIGNGSQATDDNVVSFGAGENEKDYVATRKLINVTNGEVADGSTEVVTGDQLWDITRGNILGGTITGDTKGNSIAIGANTTIKGSNGLALGYNAQVDLSGVGEINKETASAIAIGSNASVSGADSLAIGVATNVESTAKRSTALGYNSTVSGTGSVAIGSNSTASGSSSIALGEQNRVDGEYSILIGTANESDKDYVIMIGANDDGGSNSGTYTVSVGFNNEIGDVTDAVTLGNYNSVSANYGIAIGMFAEVSGTNSIAIGSGSLATEENVVSFGAGASASSDNPATRKLINVTNGTVADGSTEVVTGDQLWDITKGNILGGTITGDTAVGQESIAIGKNSSITTNDSEFAGSIALGNGVTITGNGNIGIGSHMTITDSTFSIAMGYGAQVMEGGDSSIVIGTNSSVSRYDAIAIGTGATSSAVGGIVIGAGSLVKGENGIAIGKANEVSGTNSIAIGYGAEATEDNVVSFGAGATREEDYGYVATRKLINVTNGEVADGSTEVVTGDQLWDTNQSVNALSTKVDGYDTKITNLTETVNGYDSKITNLTETVGDYDSRIEAVEGKTTNISHSTGGTIVDGVTFNKGAVSGVTSLEATSATIGSVSITGDTVDGVDVSALNDTVSGVKSSVDSLNTNVSALQNKTTDISYSDGTTKIASIAIKGGTVSGVTSLEATSAAIGSATIGNVSITGDTVDGVDVSALNDTVSGVKSSVDGFSSDISSLKNKTQGISYSDGTTTIEGVNFSNGVITTSEAITGGTINGATITSNSFNGLELSGSGTSIAIGKESNASGTNSIALGIISQATAEGAMALGSATNVAGAYSIALGSAAQVKESATNSVAIGSGSIAKEENVVSFGRGNESLGSDDADAAIPTTRKLINVTNGTIADGSTEVVTGDQLYDTNQSISALSTKVSDYNSRIEAVEGKTTGISYEGGTTTVGGVSFKDGAMTATSATIGGISIASGQVDGVDVSDLNNTVSGLSDDVSTLQTNTAGITRDGSTTTIEGKVAITNTGAVSGVTSLNATSAMIGGVSITDGKVDGVDVSALNDTVSSVKSSVEGFSSDIDSLKNKTTGISYSDGTTTVGGVRFAGGAMSATSATIGGVSIADGKISNLTSGDIASDNKEAVTGGAVYDMKTALESAYKEADTTLKSEITNAYTQADSALESAYKQADTALGSRIDGAVSDIATLQTKTAGIGRSDNTTTIEGKVAITNTGAVSGVTSLNATSAMIGGVSITNGAISGATINGATITSNSFNGATITSNSFNGVKLDGSSGLTIGSKVESGDVVVGGINLTDIQKQLGTSSSDDPSEGPDTTLAGRVEKLEGKTEGITHSEDGTSVESVTFKDGAMSATSASIGGVTIAGGAVNATSATIGDVSISGGKVDGVDVSTLDSTVSGLSSDIATLQTKTTGISYSGNTTTVGGVNFTNGAVSAVTSLTASGAITGASFNGVSITTGGGLTIGSEVKDGNVIVGGINLTDIQKQLGTSDSDGVPGEGPDTTLAGRVENLEEKTEGITRSDSTTTIENVTFNSGAMNATSATIGDVSISEGKISNLTSGNIASGNNEAVTGGAVYDMKTALENAYQSADSTLKSDITTAYQQADTALKGDITTLQTKTAGISYSDGTTTVDGVSFKDGAVSNVTSLIATSATIGGVSISEGKVDGVDVSDLNNTVTELNSNVSTLQTNTAGISRSGSTTTIEGATFNNGAITASGAISGASFNGATITNNSFNGVTFNTSSGLTIGSEVESGDVVVGGINLTDIQKQLGVSEGNTPGESQDTTLVGRVEKLEGNTAGITRSDSTTTVEGVTFSSGAMSATSATIGGVSITEGKVDGVDVSALNDSVSGLSDDVSTLQTKTAGITRSGNTTTIEGKVAITNGGAVSGVTSLTASGAISGASFNGANITSDSFNGATITSNSFNGVTLDGSTKSGLTIGNSSYAGDVIVGGINLSDIQEQLGTSSSDDPSEGPDTTLAGRVEKLETNTAGISRSDSTTTIEEVTFTDGAMSATSATIGDVSIAGGKISDLTSGDIASGNKEAVTGGAVYDMKTALESAYKEADSTLKSDITSAYTKADTTLKSEVTTAYKEADSALESAYKQADTALGSRIDSAVSDITTLQSKTTDISYSGGTTTVGGVSFNGGAVSNVTSLTASGAISGASFNGVTFTTSGGLTIGTKVENGDVVVGGINLSDIQKQLGTSDSDDPSEGPDTTLAGRVEKLETNTAGISRSDSTTMIENVTFTDGAMSATSATIGGVSISDGKVNGATITSNSFNGVTLDGSSGLTIGGDSYSGDVIVGGINLSDIQKQLGVSDEDSNDGPDTTLSDRITTLEGKTEGITHSEDGTFVEGVTFKDSAMTATSASIGGVTISDGAVNATSASIGGVNINNGMVTAQSFNGVSIKESRDGLIIGKDAYQGDIIIGGINLSDLTEGTVQDLSEIEKKVTDISYDEEEETTSVDGVSFKDGDITAVNDITATGNVTAATFNGAYFGFKDVGGSNHVFADTIDLTQMYEDVDALKEDMDRLMGYPNGYPDDDSDNNDSDDGDNTAGSGNGGENTTPGQGDNSSGSGNENGSDNGSGSGSGSGSGGNGSDGSNGGDGSGVGDEDLSDNSGHSYGYVESTVVSDRDKEGNQTTTTVETKEDGLYITTETKDKDGNVIESSKHNVGESLDRLENGLSQVQQDMASLDRRVGELDQRISDVGAMSAAMASLKSLGYDPEAPTEISASVGKYQGSTAYAIGVFHYANRDLMFNVQYAAAGSRETMVSGGVTVRVGRKSHEPVIEQGENALFVPTVATEEYQKSATQLITALERENYGIAQMVIAEPLQQRMTLRSFEGISKAIKATLGQKKELVYLDSEALKGGMKYVYRGVFEKGSVVLTFIMVEDKNQAKVYNFMVQPESKVLPFEEEWKVKAASASVQPKEVYENADSHVLKLQDWRKEK